MSDAEPQNPPTSIKNRSENIAVDMSALLIEVSLSLTIPYEMST